MENRRVIVLGSAHENTIGMVQSLGRKDLYVIGVLLQGGGVVRKSIYVKEIYPVADYQEGIEFISKNLVFPSPTVIIPCGDEAALILEKNKDLLEDHFVFQHTDHSIALAVAMNKHFQTEIASSCGFDVPSSFVIEKDKPFDNNNFMFPCIIKPLASCEGDKNDIRVARSYEELDRSLFDIFKHSHRAIVQEFIEKKDFELNILGCGLSNGDCVVPCSIRKLRIHPYERGSVSVGLVEPISDELLPIVKAIKRMVSKLGYVGLFSIELMCVKSKQKNYFIEMNLRNDALNPFVVKNGVNLPYIHFMDLVGETTFPFIIPISVTAKMIMEPIHFTSLYRRSVSVWDWIKDIISADAFSLYYKEDWRLFWSLFADRIKSRLCFSKLIS